MEIVFLKTRNKVTSVTGVAEPASAAVTNHCGVNCVSSVMHVVDSAGLILPDPTAPAANPAFES